MFIIVLIVFSHIISLGAVLSVVHVMASMPTLDKPELKLSGWRLSWRTWTVRFGAGKLMMISFALQCLAIWLSGKV